MGLVKGISHLSVLPTTPGQAGTQASLRKLFQHTPPRDGESRQGYLARLHATYTSLVARNPDAARFGSEPIGRAMANCTRGPKTDPDGRLREGRARVRERAKTLVTHDRDRGVDLTDIQSLLFLDLVARGAHIGDSMHPEEYDERAAEMAFAQKALQAGVRYMADALLAVDTDPQQIEIPATLKATLEELRSADTDWPLEQVDRGKLARSIKYCKPDTLLYVLREIQQRRGGVELVKGLRRKHFTPHSGTKTELKGMMLPLMLHMVEKASQYGVTITAADYADRLDKFSTSVVHGRIAAVACFVANRRRGQIDELQKLARTGNEFALEILIIGAVLENDSAAQQALIELAQLNGSELSLTKQAVRDRARQVLYRFFL